MKTHFHIFLLLGFTMTAGSGLFAQNLPFSLQIQELNHANVPALQSYAHAQHGDYWLLMAGMTGGLHDFRPPMAFPVASANDSIYVMDVADDSLWAAPLTSLPLPLQAQLSSTNPQFYQDGNQLYLIGGYGYSPAEGDHTTFPMLTVIDVPGLVAAIRSGQAMLAPFFRQISDSRLAVTGGHLEKLDSTFYLVFGQRFEGRYNPHNGPSFVQTYTNAIRTFQIRDNGQSLALTHFQETIDAVNFHRRDYNLVPQFFAGGVEGMTAFTGVFQYNVDLPFLNSVHISAQGARVENSFRQLLNQYHSAFLPIYDSAADEMYNIFFGGISLYHPDQTGALQIDSMVPFVNHISLVRRFDNDSMAEYLLPVSMPGLLGAGAEFFPHPQAPRFANGIIDYEALSDQPTLLGYVYGGIESSQANIFMQSTGSSWASDRLFAVYLTRDNPQALDPVKIPEISLSFRIAPNPGEDYIDATFSLNNSSHTTIFWQNTEGKILTEMYFGRLGPGEYAQRFDISDLPAGLYYLTLTTNHGQETRKIIRK